MTTTTRVPTPAPIDCNTLHWRVDETIIEVDVTPAFNNVTASGQGEEHRATIGKDKAIISSLPAGCTYEVSVWKDQYKLCNISRSLNAPPVTNLQVSPNSTSGLSVSWDRTPGCIKGYGVSYNDTHIENIIGNVNSTVIEKLDPGCLYIITVTTIADGNDSTPVNTTGTTNAPPVTNLQVSPKSTSGLSVSWDRTLGCIKGYRVSYNDTHIENIIGNVNSTVIEKLDPGCLYIITVTTIADGNDSTPVYTNGTTNPSPVSDITVMSKSTNQINYHWTVPNNTRVAQYQYSVTLENVAPSSTDKNSYTANELKPGEKYTLCIESVTPEHTRSTPECLSTYTNPSAPVDLTASENTTTALVSWSAPSSDVNYQNYTYLLSWSSSDLNESKVINETSASLTALIPGSLYSVRVQSQIGDAQSVGVSLSILTVPAQVSSLQCSAVSGGYSLLLNWGNPAGHWTAIEVDVSNGDKMKVEKCEPVQFETRINGLSPAQYYTISVTTVSGEKRSFRAVSIRCQTDTTGVIVGAVFGVLMLICLVVFLVLFILRRYPDLLSSSSKDDDALEFACKKMKPIEVSKFADYFHRQQADSDIGFAEEYQSLGAVGTEQTSKAALLPENRGKNRFTNVLPYDWCRVKLSAIDGDPFSDYINANFMPGYHTAKEFIAAQGPLPNTVEDFWRMAWENQVEAIVMLTNCVENSKVKCEQYWPLDYTPCTYGCISVTTSSEQKLPDWTLRDFTVKHTKSLEYRTVKQFHFTAWPDHGVPDNTATLIQFRALVRKFLDDREGSGPALVHCSAGVGRTGTLIALDSLLLQIEREKVVGIQSFVQKMRLHRPLMVQTESQYIFLNQCMLDTIQGKMKNPDENIYENLIYANTAALGEFHATNGNAS
ncbi:receptor-type tyrosine-protein phosphatase H-like isoform X2 [Polyodon spathula]|nr:receptor-type tyrosine-protein phosphatase H-like isoform X2 [Polyodon spathula]